MYLRVYVDVRGPWPTLFVGMCSYRLVNAPFSITVAEAMNLLDERGEL